MRLPRNDKLLGNARALRREMTKEERHLWYDFLRGHVPRFTRQKILRFSNLDVMQNFEGVCLCIERTVRERMR